MTPEGERVDALARALTEAAPLRPGIHAEAAAILAALTEDGWSVEPAGVANMWNRQELLDIFDRTADRPGVRAKIAHLVQGGPDATD